MSNQAVEAPESDYFAKSRSKTFKAIEEVAVETFVRDRSDFLDEIAEALGIETEELPKVSVEITVHFGKDVVKLSGFEKEEEEKDDE